MESSGSFSIGIQDDAYDISVDCFLLKYRNIFKYDDVCFNKYKNTTTLLVTLSNFAKNNTIENIKESLGNVNENDEIRVILNLIKELKKRNTSEFYLKVNGISRVQDMDNQLLDKIIIFHKDKTGKILTLFKNESSVHNILGSFYYKNNQIYKISPDIYLYNDFINNDFKTSVDSDFKKYDDDVNNQFFAMESFNNGITFDSYVSRCGLSAVADLFCSVFEFHIILSMKLEFGDFWHGDLSNEHNIIVLCDENMDIPRRRTKIIDYGMSLLPHSKSIKVNEFRKNPLIQAEYHENYAYNNISPLLSDLQIILKHIDKLLFNIKDISSLNPLENEVILLYNDLRSFINEAFLHSESQYSHKDVHLSNHVLNKDSSLNEYSLKKQNDYFEYTRINQRGKFHKFIEYYSSIMQCFQKLNHGTTYFDQYRETVLLFEVLSFRTYHGLYNKHLSSQVIIEDVVKKIYIVVNEIIERSIENKDDESLKKAKENLLKLRNTIETNDIDFFS